jgi:hypothetical protein
MEAAYREWADDLERAEAVQGLANAVLAEGGLIDQVLGSGPDALPLSSS